MTAIAVMQPPLAAQSMQSVAPVFASRIADDPDVLGAERLFSAWIEGQIAYRGLPGIAVGVVSDQDLVWTKGFGYADVNAKVPMTPTTKFRMASHSKLFAATAIMQLREEGKLRLDDPVATYLPWFKAKSAGDDDGTITIHSDGRLDLNDNSEGIRLLTLDGGLPDWRTAGLPVIAGVST